MPPLPQLLNHWDNRSGLRIVSAVMLMRKQHSCGYNTVIPTTIERFSGIGKNGHPPIARSYVKAVDFRHCSILMPASHGNRWQSLTLKQVIHNREEPL